ncbi:MAG: hypothetical protein J6R40_01535, partial [Clostridia bacterium]|nr:hypothetical protein [Clostridia bacterium]
MQKNHTIAIEFLLWSYFNLKNEQSPESIIKSCIKRAYSDATNQGAYNAIRDKETEPEKSYHDTLY